jgi:hypothetical protein
VSDICVVAECHYLVINTDLCQICVLLQSAIIMSFSTDLCQMISVLLQSAIIMSFSTDLCQMISVLLQSLINSTKHLDKSLSYRFLLPWLGTGLLTSTGEMCRQQNADV